MVTLSFGDHIEELRWRLILAILGVFVGVIATLIPPLNLGRNVMWRMKEPAQRVLETFVAKQRQERAAVARSYSLIPARIPAEAFARAVGQVFPQLPAPSPAVPQAGYVELPLELKDSGLINAVDVILGPDNRLIALGPMEVAMIFFRTCLVTGLVLASPWVFFQVWAFIAAGLYRHERAMVYKFLPYSLGLFLAGVAICFFAVLPLTLRFLLEFNVWLGISPMLQLREWMGFATVLPLAFGLCFQMPLVMVLLAKVGIFTASDYRVKRKLAFMIILVVAAILTPGPDVSSMFLLSLPMVLLYELGIRLVEPSRPLAVG